MSGESSSTRTMVDGGLASGGDAATMTLPPLRAEPRTEQPTDGQLLSALMGEWTSQTPIMRHRDMAIEENISFLSGRQWVQYNDVLGRLFDVSEWMSEEEKRYRQRPVVNLLLPWFLTTHARMTENPPIITVVPGPDQKDAQLAEIQDILAKTTWRDAGMTDVIDRLYAWMIPSGEVFWMSRIDLTKGAFKPRVARAAVPVHANGAPLSDDQGPITVEMDGVPLDDQWQPMAFVDAQSQQMIPTAEPVYDREGQIAVDVLPAMCVRGQLGQGIPWHEKSWHMTVGFYTAEFVWDTWGVDVQPDTAGLMSENASLEALLFGNGFFTPQDSYLPTGGTTMAAKRNLCRVYQYWQKPSLKDRQLRQTPTSPGGRYTVFTSSRVLVDGTRPVAFPYTSPIRKAEFVRIPGRPAGTSVQNSLNGPQRNYNKRRGQLGEHATLTANPKAVIDRSSGLKDGQWTNEPGTAVVVNMRAQIDPVKWLTPPALGSAVPEDADRSRDEIETIGSTRGTDAAPLASDESGEARKERRFDGDRYIGPTQRRMVTEMARMWEDWNALYPVIYDEQRVIRDAGEDNQFRSVLLMPELFTQGNTHISPDLESMLPESKGERQARIYTLWKDGALGDPTDPAVRQTFLEMSRFPNLSRVTRFGSVDAQTADQENGAMLQGQPVPVMPYYDHAEHIRIHNKFRKTRDYLKVDPMIRQAFDMHCAMHEQQLAIQQFEQEQAMLRMGGMQPPGAPPAPTGGGPRPSMVRAEAQAAQPSGIQPSQGPSNGAPGRLPPRVLGSTAATPQALQP